MASADADAREIGLLEVGERLPGLAGAPTILTSGDVRSLKPGLRRGEPVVDDGGRGGLSPHGSAECGHGIHLQLHPGGLR
jgi:hypothetical protein